LPESEDIDQTLREDYEFFLEDNILEISYKCSCDVSSFEFGFKKIINLLNPKQGSK